jgi:hypothetical protein
MRRYWKPEEVEVLTALYADSDTEAVARRLNREVKSIHYKANKLGLRKSAAFLKSMAQNSHLAVHGAQYRYKKGSISWNKGKKLPAHVVEKTRATQFRAGHMPHNTKPFGYVAARRDSSGNVYQYIKAPGYRCMILLHRWLWEQINGPIPSGKIIRYKDGNTMNCVISNLELIDRRQHMKRNSFMRYPEDYRGVLQARRVLTRIINQQLKAI